jgi:hypothetical protein
MKKERQVHLDPMEWRDAMRGVAQTQPARGERKDKKTPRVRSTKKARPAATGATRKKKSR